MCQPKSKGGKRCAAHHPATLAMKFNIKNSSRLEQGQIDHAFKALRKVGKNFPDPTAEQYQEFLQSQRQAVVDSEIGQTMKNRMLGKIDKAIEDDQVPNGATYYALTHLKDRSNKSWRTLATKMREYAQTNGTTPSSAMRQFRGLYASAVSPRGGEVDYTSTLDPKTLAVLEQMQASYEPKFEETPRITRTPTDTKTIVAYGYDPEDGRLEVEYFNGGVYAYHSVSAEDYERFKNTPVAVFNELRMSNAHQYENSIEAERDAYRVYCDKCKEFKVASGHVCTDGNVSGAVVSRKSVDDVYKKVKDAYRNGGVTAEETPLVTPSWATPAEEREQHVMPDDSYTETGGSQGRTPSGAKRIVPDKDAIVAQLRDGKTVTMHVGRKVAIADTDQTEFYSITTPVTMSMVRGNMSVSVQNDWSQAKCTCDAYRTNGRCKHIYPNEGSMRRNRFLEEDVNRSIAEVLGSDLTQTSPYDSGENYAFMTTGHRLAPENSTSELSNYRGLSEDELSQVRYALSQGTDATATIRVKNESTGRLHDMVVSASEDGALSFRSDTYSTPMELTNKIKGQIENELRNTNFVASRLARNAERMIEEGWEMQPESRQAYLARFTRRTTDGYLANTDRFVADYKAAQANAGNPLPFTTTPVTGGYLSASADEPNARGFGVELEFDIGSGHDRYRALEAIGRDLHAAGLTQSSHQSYYHSAARNGYSSWSFEEDCSVAGEIVSPILYDNEESWDQIRQVCEIAKRHGAVASVRAGSHVHIGAQGLDNHARRGVLAATSAHQDVVRRVATSTERGTHRTSEGENSYSASFSDADINYAYESRRSGVYLDRYRMVNFQGSNTLEFRDPDATLDPGHIQAQVMMSAALVAAGESNEWDNVGVSDVRRQRVGANAARQPYVDNAIEDDDERIIASNISLMTTLDALFPDDNARKRMLEVAARVPWQQERSRRDYY